MNTPFDAKKALSEEITGLADVVKTITVRRRASEEQLGEAEAELNALRKLEAFALGELARKRSVLTELQRKEQAGQ